MIWRVFVIVILYLYVPTPMYEDGSQDLSYVENAFEKATDKPIHILKSTVLPELRRAYRNNTQTLKLFFHLNF